MSQALSGIKSSFGKLKHKAKDFFKISNLKKHFIGLLVATLLLIIDIVVAYALGYRTEHNYIYNGWL